MSVDIRINELEKDIEKLERRLKAKDATILGINLKKERFVADSNVQCSIHSMFTYDEFFYVITEITNISNHKLIASGLCISSSPKGTGYSETVVGIFDELKPVKFIESCSKRKLVISARKGILVEPKLILEIEFQLVSTELPVDLPLIPNFPTLDVSGHMRDSFFFPIERPVEALLKGNITDISFEEGVLLYQGLCTSHDSRYLEFQSAQLNTVFLTLNTFNVIDFGDWMLAVGFSDYEGLLAVCSNSNFFQPVRANCRIFAKGAVSLKRFERMLEIMINDGWND
uniref:Uncharacterized protein n=1 Tax=Syphacia muris TaxID=451379 RepID=A0A0N5AWW6_9BILA